MTFDNESEEYIIKPGGDMKSRIMGHANGAQRPNANVPIVSTQIEILREDQTSEKSDKSFRGV